ncbi:MAG: YbhB/YbcL family Raf kinase inhibitor-like protein [Gammaproteobacteria bacterium]|nr:YbhB/YbcL family Raf kinase inhibitor-like protein [Gammaproteobacteria bacterium]
MTAFILTSSAFHAGGLIPEKYTCDGEDISPALTWQGAPAGTQSFVLVLDDPDAPVGIWDHWLLFNIPANTQVLPEGMNALPPGTQEGLNSWHRLGYGGPCPPDTLHRYFFKLYALDTTLSLPEGVKKPLIEAAMQDHILATAELMAKYDRPR